MAMNFPAPFQTVESVSHGTLRSRIIRPRILLGAM